MKIKHQYLEVSCKAFIDYLDDVYSPFAAQIDQDFPIMIMNTGDEVFLSNMQGETNAGTELYSMKPRMTMDVGGIGIIADQLTNYNGVLGNVEINNDSGFKESKVFPVRRIPIELTINTQIVFNNIFEYFTFVEVFLSLSKMNHTFEFYYKGSVYQGAFTVPLSYDSSANLQLAYDSEKRQRTLDLQFILELQYPAFEFYTIRNGVDGSGWESENGEVDGSNGFGKSETMNKIIHNMHVDDPSEQGIVSTIEVTKPSSGN